MVRARSNRSYPGVTTADLEGLREAVLALRELRGRCHPLSHRAEQISKVIAGYQGLAFEVTGTRFYYGGIPEQMMFGGS